MERGTPLTISMSGRDDRELHGEGGSGGDGGVLHTPIVRSRVFYGAPCRWDSLRASFLHILVISGAPRRCDAGCLSGSFEGLRQIEIVGSVLEVTTIDPLVMWRDDDAKLVAPEETGCGAFVIALRCFFSRRCFCPRTVDKPPRTQQTNPA